MRKFGCGLLFVLAAGSCVALAVVMGHLVYRSTESIAVTVRELAARPAAYEGNVQLKNVYLRFIRTETRSMLATEVGSTIGPDGNPALTTNFKPASQTIYWYKVRDKPDDTSEVDYQTTEKLEDGYYDLDAIWAKEQQGKTYSLN